MCVRIPFGVESRPSYMIPSLPSEVLMWAFRICNCDHFRRQHSAKTSPHDTLACKNPESKTSGVKLQEKV